MTKKTLPWYFILLFIGSAFIADQPIYTGNPIINHFEAADPEVAFVNNKYYIYPTDNTKPQAGFDVWSSDNLKDWKNEGPILTAEDVSFAKSRYWAPGFAERNGRYYFYFSAHDRIGVGVSNSPTGPFKEALGKPLVPYQADLSTIDPMAFIDDDGQAYLYWGAVPGSWRRDSADVIYNSLFVQKLKSDMVTPEGPMGFTIRSTDDHIEGSFVFKRNGIYYLMYSAGNYNAKADDPHAYRVEYATANSPLGPFEKGKNSPVLISDGNIGMASPGHNSVLHLPGTDDWYMVYHAHNGDVKRRVFISKMEFDENGQIKKVKPDLQGVKLQPIRLKLEMEKPGPYLAGQTVLMEAAATWDKEETNSVAFFAGDKKIGEISQPPFRFAWKKVPKGHYQVFAKATSQSGETASSSVWKFDVE